MNWRPRILPATVLATFVLILLGIYTAAIGAGLTCNGRWPLCDGAVFGLFPANWTSFVEWFHRLVAMVTGFMILGSWWTVWRGETARRARIVMTVAVALLPVQVWLGAETVFQYEVLILTAHFLTALVIFGALLTATWWVVGIPFSARRSRQLLGAAGLLFVPFVLLTPHFLVIHSGRVQILYFGIGLTIFALLVILALDGLGERPRFARRTGGIAGIGLLLLAAQLLAGRLVRSPLVHTIDWIGAIVLGALILIGLWAGRHGGIARRPSSG